MNQSSKVVAVAVSLAVSVGGGAQAQPLAELVPNLFDRTIILANPDHAAHFLDDSARLASLGAGVNESIASQLSTFPLASPGGGLTYQFDADTGVFERTSNFLGSLYGQRALTVGKNIWNYGITGYSIDFDSLDGFALDSGEMQFQLTHLDIAGPGPDLFFEGDLINAQIRLQVSTQTTLAFATYGVSDRFDVSFAVPFVDTEIDATGVLTIDRLGSVGIPQIHNFTEEPGAVDLDGDGLLDQLAFANGGSASGIGDVLVRGKYRFRDLAGGGFATTLDIRLPTGDEDDLLGTGGTQVKLGLVGSRELHKWSSHFALGYNATEGGDRFDVPDELTVEAGIELAASRRATLALDVVGRFQQDAMTVDVNQETFTFKPGPFAVDEQTVSRPVLSTRETTRSPMLGVLGLRFNPTGNLLISANLLASIGDDGLTTDDVVPVVSLDYSR